MPHADSAPSVTICVPVYNGARFVAATLQSALAQTFPAIRLLVSVDPGADDSLQVCRSLERDARVQVIAQPERRGWVGNTNDLIRRVETDYYCILPQDDLLDPRYVEVVHQRLAAHPEAVCAYTDLQTFGDLVQTVEQLSLTGPVPRRIVTFLLGRMAAVSFRGLIARGRLPPETLLRHNAAGDFAADTVWMLDLACAGELHRIEGVFYAKRLHGDSETQRWASRVTQRKLGDLVEHCVQCATIALGAVSEPATRAAVMLAAAVRFRRRLAQFESASEPGVVDEPARRSASADFHARTGVPADFPALAAQASGCEVGLLLATLPEVAALGMSGPEGAVTPEQPLAGPAPLRTEVQGESAAEYLNLGRSLRQANRFDEAARAFRRALERDARLLAAFKGLATSVAQGAAGDAGSRAETTPRDIPPRQSSGRSLSVVICGGDPASRTRIRAHYETQLAGHRFEIIQIDNAASLAEGCNRGFAQSSGDLVIFSQDDLEILSDDFAGRLLGHFEECDLFGVSGTSRLISPFWTSAHWPHLHGCMAHPLPAGALAFEWFGPSARSGIQAIDGFFFAATRAVCQAIAFDADTFDGAHLHGMDFSYRAHRAGFRCRVGCDLLLSVIRRHDAAWQRYANRFMEKHSDRLLDAAPAPTPDWATLRLPTRPVALEFHRRMLRMLRETPPAGR